jgi:hypothetical protein
MLTSLYWLFFYSTWVLDTDDSIFYNSVIDYSGDIINLIQFFVESSYINQGVSSIPDGSSLYDFSQFPISYLTFNFVLGKIFSSNPAISVLIVNILFTMAISNLLKITRFNNSVLHTSILLLFLSPTVFYYGHTLHKELFALVLTLFFVSSYISKKYFLSILFFIAAIFTRRYTPLVMLIYLFLYYYDLYGYKMLSINYPIFKLTKGGKFKFFSLEIIKKLFIVMIILIILLVYYRYNQYFQVQFFSIFIAYFSTPLFFKAANWQGFMWMPTMETLLILIVCFLLFIGLLVKKNIHKANYIILGLLLVYTLLIATEASQLFVLVVDTGGLLGEEIPRKRISILLVIYYFLIFNYQYYFTKKVNRK